MTFQDDAEHPLYRFIRQTRPDGQGVWGIYYPRANDGYNRDEWLRKKRLRDERDREIERQRLQTCLSPKERDAETRKVLRQLMLSDGDRRYLLGRGVPLAVIERCRSVGKFQEFGDAVHVNLPGVSKYGNRLNNPSNGILVPIPDGQGNLACMRLHDRIDRSKKYSWLTSKSRGIDARLSSGEYPIGYYYPEQIKDGDRIGVCEGMEFKAPVAAIRLGFPVVGFSGCNFKGAMQQLSPLAEGKIITIIPDAGAVKNKHVLQSLTDAIYKFEANGLAVDVAWWGQFDKADGDIDEIDPNTKIEFLSVTEFLSLADQKPKKNQFYQAFVNLSNKLFGGIGGIKKTAKRLKTGLVRSTVNHFYKPGDGAKTYQDLVRDGYKWILDISPTGSGKTHTVGQLIRGMCFLVPDDDAEVMTKILYCPPSHRNPTSAVIESEWYETVARNNGYYVNYGKTTDLGSPYREALDGEVDSHERTQSNCHLAAKFHQYYAAGRDTKGICGGCQYREKCAVKKGDGYGYISESKKWVTEPLIRTSIQWLDKEKVQIALTGLILDEAGQVQWQIERKIELIQLFQIMDVIRKADRELHKKLVDIEYALRDMIGDSVPTWGYNTKEILSKVVIDKEVESLLPAIAAIELENIGNPDDVNPVFLCDLIEILLGKANGSLLLTDKHLTITTKNNRLIQACHAAKWVICQDATWSKEYMAMKLGINPEEIYVICQEQEKTDNLVIEQWSGVGNLGNNRSETCQKRTKTMREQIIEWYQEKVGFIDWKRYGQSTDLVHCGDSRGSNAYKEKEIVVSFGLSRPNMTAIRLEYETMTGHIIDDLNDVSFSQFYNHIVAANLVQEIGRLRANRRKGQDLKFILIGDGDISFLEELGFDLVMVDAAEKFPDLDLGWKGARARYINLAMKFCRSMDAVKWLEMTMGECSEMFNRAISSLSKFIKRWFGVEGDKKGIAFERFKSLVYAAIYGTNGHEKQLSDDELITVNAVSEMLSKVHYVGDELGSELKMIIDVMGWELFLESVKRLKNDYGIKLLGRIFRVAVRTKLA